MEIRAARPEEYDAVGELTLAGYTSDGLLSGAVGAHDEYKPQLLDAKRRALSAELIVAVEDDTILGTLTWCPDGSPLRELARRSDQGEFRMLAVDARARRRGAARALVTWSLERARADGLSEMVLCSLPEMTKAHALYASLGFTRAPELDWFPRNEVTLWGFRLKL